MKDKCQAHNLLSENQLKITKQREDVLSRIIELDKPFNVNELRSVLGGNFDIVTIYRILEAFSRKGIVREVSSLNGVRYFELSCVHHPIHPHFICEHCHSIYCLGAIDYKDSLKLGKYADTHSISGISINFTGICGQCGVK
jgi:Fur family ferric uptake transcriptional regulator